MKETGNAEIFAANLRRYTKLSGRTGKFIAEEIGVSPAAYSYWMSGKKYPRIDMVEKLAEYFHISKSDLIDERPKKKVDPQTVEARIISVGVDKMSPEDREKALNMMRVMFAEIYANNDDWSDDDAT